MLVFAAGSACLLGAEQAPAPSSTQRIVVYEAGSSSSLATRRERELRLGRLATGAYGPHSDFSARARLHFTTETRLLAQTSPLRLGVPTRPPQDSGWVREKDIFAWSGQGDLVADKVTLPLSAEPVQNAQPFGEYDELWAEFYSVSNVAPCAMQVELALTSRPQVAQGRERVILARAGNGFIPKTLAYIEPSSSAWQQKDLWYVARRVLGLTGDEAWRYSAVGELAVLQRRWRVPLDEVQFVDVAIAQGAPIIHINLRISGGGLGGGRVVQFPNMHGNSTLPDGRPGLRLDIRDAMEKQFPGRKRGSAGSPAGEHLQLEEVWILFAGEPRNIVDSAPIRRIELVAADSQLVREGEAAEHLLLPSKVTGYAGHRQRLVVDVRALRTKGDVQLREAVVKFFPNNPAIACAIRVGEMKGAKLYADSVPSFAARLENAVRRWGDVHETFAPDRGYVESPEVLAYLPFAALSAGEASYRDLTEYVLKLGANHDAQIRTAAPATRGRSYRVVGPDGREHSAERDRLVSSTGAVATFAGAVPQVASSEGAAVWEGFFHSIDIAWPLKTLITPATWLFVAVPEGAEQMARVSLFLETEDGRSLHRTVVPNQPQTLVTLPTELRGVRMHIMMTSTAERVRVKLGEIVLFKPKLLTYGDAFSAALPVAHKASPVPELRHGEKRPFLVQAGQIGGLVAHFRGQDMQFSIPLDPPLTAVRGLRLRYRLPSELLDSEPCPVWLQMNWANARIERQVCFDRPSGEDFIPFANLLGSSPRASNLGPLQSIDWAIRLKSIPESADRESFDLHYSIDGWALLSAADEIRASPLFYAGRQPVFAEREAVAQLAQGTYAQRATISVDTAPIWRMAQSADEFRFHSGKWYVIEEVSVQSNSGIPEQHWRQLTQVPAITASARWPWGLAGALMLVGTWFVAKRRAWSMRPTWRRIRSTSATALGFGQDLARRAARWVRGHSKAANVVVALLALGPGLWFSGRLGWSFSGAMLLIAIIFVAWGAYGYWKGSGRSEFSAVHGPHARLAILTVAAASAIWAAGRYHFTRESLWGLLPLLGAAYAFVPQMLDAGTAIMRRHGRHVPLLAWLLVTVGLYARGALSQVPGENFYFTFAGVAAVLAWRAAARSLEPTLRALIPVPAARVYGAPGGIYFAGALVALAGASLTLMLKRQVETEQLATVLYYFIIVALVRQAWMWRSDSGADSPGSPPADATNTRNR